MLLERLIADGSYDRQVATLVTAYRSKRDVMLDALEEHLGGYDGVYWTRPSGGLYVWLTLPEGLDAGLAGPFFQRCLDEGGCCTCRGRIRSLRSRARCRRNHARLCFGVPGEAQLAEGVRRLAKALAGCLDPVA